MYLLSLKRFRCIALLPLGYLLISLAQRNPQMTEEVYSNGVYLFLRDTLGRAFAYTPFHISMAELCILTLPILLIIYIVVQIRRIRSHAHERKQRVARLASTFICLLSVGYFTFVLVCGLNYQRLPFADISGLEVRPSSAEELGELCQELVQQANALREQMDVNEYGVMVTGLSFEEKVGTAASGYALLGEEYGVLGGYTTRPKRVLFSRTMSRLDLVGIYIPFTFEANVNVDVPHYAIPSSMMHELAHFKGFMREDEANFISYLACNATGQAEFQYSGVMLALVHSSNALYSADRDLYWSVMDSRSQGVQADFAANSAYWKQFEGPAAQVSTAVNNAYLKSNGQSGGVKSYGRMVDLLLADYRERHGLS